MATELRIPELGRNVESITVVSLLVKPGDTVVIDQPLLEVETGKAVAELAATQAGVLRQFLVQKGQEVKSGQPFAVLEPSGAAPAAEPAAPVERPVPEAKPAPAAIPAPKSGPVSPDAAPAPAPTAPEGPVRHVPAAPSVRRFAREIGIDVDAVRGTGQHGRVSTEDVQRRARELQAARREGAVVPGLELPPLPDFAAWGPVRTEPMSGIRHATAVQVTRAALSIPCVTHFDQADITSLEGLRRTYADRAEALGGKLTMAVMVVKVCSLALRKFPQFNASVDMANRRIVYKDYVHMGIAVATPRGLMVPVVRDADRKNMVQLAAEIAQLAKVCRDGRAQPAQLEGATFTVTNLGRIGGSHFTPIIHYPEVAILGMGRAAEQVALRDGRPEPRVRLPLSLTYDHRLIDGADAAAFVRWIAEAIEEPLLLALEG